MEENEATYKRLRYHLFCPHIAVGRYLSKNKRLSLHVHVIYLRISTYTGRHAKAT